MGILVAVQRSGAVILALFDGPNLGVIAVILVDLDVKPVTHMLAQQDGAHGGVLADQPVEHVLADSGDDLPGLLLLVLLQPDLDTKIRLRKQRNESGQREP